MCIFFFFLGGGHLLKYFYRVITNVYTRIIYRVECLCVERIFFSSQSLQPMHVISQHNDYQIHRVYGCWERRYFVTNSSNPITIFNFTVLAWWIYRIGCVCVWLYFVNLVNHKCWGVFLYPPLRHLLVRPYVCTYGHWFPGISPKYFTFTVRVYAYWMSVRFSAPWLIYLAPMVG